MNNYEKRNAVLWSLAEISLLLLSWVALVRYLSGLAGPPSLRMRIIPLL